jgi:3-oxoacyl-[acyl-carrier protein] reductase
MRRLDGKVALVTGAARGIGAAIARRLGQDGAAVAVGYGVNRDKAEQVAAAIAQAGGSAVAVGAELSQVSAAAPLVASVVEHFGKLDLLICNAAVAEWRPLAQIDAEHYGRVFDVNVRAPLLLAKAAAPHLGVGGRIIHISSGAAQVPMPGGSVYAASKAALEAFTRCHAAELGPRGITVNTVAPGLVATDMLNQSLPAEVQQAMVKNTALGRLGQPEDIAEVVAFLASDEGRWITGQVLAVHGGLRG